MTFQVLSRNEDKDGKRYMLILVYNQNGSVEKCYESCSLAPLVNTYTIGQLKLTHVQLPGFRLSPSEYNRQREVFVRWLVQGQ